MRRPVILALDVVVVWLALGLATLGPVSTVLRDGCHEPPPVGAHVAVWPVSVLATWGLRSRC